MFSGGKERVHLETNGLKFSFIQKGSQDPPTYKIENFATIVNGF